MQDDFWTRRHKEQSRKQKADRPWKDYPLGTKACALMGGYWLRVEHGWEWASSGCVFPTPGGDAFDVILPETVS